jgi:hypothetical protein
MARYYFDVREGDRVTRDDAGLELESLEAAEREAIRTTIGIGQDSLPRGHASEIEVQVKNDDGFLLLSVTMSLTVRRTVRGLT